MQYRVRQTGKATYLYFEEDRIEAIRPHADGVELRLGYNSEYIGNTAYSWDQSNEQHVLRLSLSQCTTVIEQDRKAQTEFCFECYDHAKSNDAGECVRCQIIKALRKKKDLRQKQSPTTLPTTTQRSPLLCWLVLALVLATSGALCAWTQAASENQSLRQKIERVKR